MRNHLESVFKESLPEGSWDRWEIPQNLYPAAVLIPLIEREQGITVLLTRRTAHLNNHPGQISFPGGRVDEGDHSPVGTALREAHEEVGIAAEKTEIIGGLPQRDTVTGFMVVPVIGFIDPQTTFVADEFEVAELLEVPLDFLLERDNYRQESIFYKGKERAFWEIVFGKHRIWGATAGILMDFAKQLNEHRRL